MCVCMCVYIHMVGQSLFLTDRVLPIYVFDASKVCMYVCVCVYIYIFVVHSLFLADRVLPVCVFDASKVCMYVYIHMVG